MKSGSPARVGNILCYSGTVWERHGVTSSRKSVFWKEGVGFLGWRGVFGFCSSFLIAGTFDADFRGVACASSPRTMALRHGNLCVPFFEHLN
jgi:hypothetical protein